MFLGNLTGIVPAHVGLAGYTQPCAYEVNKGYGQVLGWSGFVSVDSKGVLVPENGALNENTRPELFFNAVKAYQKKAGEKTPDGILGQGSWKRFLRASRSKYKADTLKVFDSRLAQYKQGMTTSYLSPTCGGESTLAPVAVTAEMKQPVPGAPPVEAPPVETPPVEAPPVETSPPAPSASEPPLPTKAVPKPFPVGTLIGITVGVILLATAGAYAYRGIRQRRDLSKLTSGRTRKRTEPATSAKKTTQTPAFVPSFEPTVAGWL